MPEFPSKIFQAGNFCCMDTPLLFIHSLSRDTWVLPPFGFCAEPLVCPDLLNWRKGCPDPHSPSLSSSKGSRRAGERGRRTTRRWRPVKASPLCWKGGTGRGAGGAAGPSSRQVSGADGRVRSEQSWGTPGRPGEAL